MSRHYLDHASTSPLRPEVLESMLPWMTGDGAADPGRVYTEGRMARAAIEEARTKVAHWLGVRSRQVVFTSGGTEAVNAAVWGAANSQTRSSILCAAVEHSSVRDASSRHGAVVDVPVDRSGRIQVDSVAAALEAEPMPALVNCQWGNHEVGTLQPVSEMTRLCSEKGVLSHVDAVAAAGHVTTNLGELEADLVSVSAHKAGGPKGVGVLVLRPGLRLEPLLVGGEQERARRAGIENTPAIVGLGALAELLSSGDVADLEVRRSKEQTNRVLSLAGQVPGVSVFGDPQDRLPHIACLGIDGVVAEAVLLGLDQAGIAAHSGSACSSESLVPSPVLEAMGLPPDQSLRISVGWSTTDDDIDALARALPTVVGGLRALAGE